ncbi:MAG: HEAT repeat domain-containing protein [Pirellulales bacterium]
MSVVFTLLACLVCVEPVGEDVPALVETLRNEPQVIEVVLLERPAFDSAGVRAAATLETFGAGAIEPLEKLLRDESRTVRLNAIRTLGRIGDPTAETALLCALDDGDAAVRAATVPFLDTLEDATIRRAVIALLKDDDDPLVRKHAARRLNQNYQKELRHRALNTAAKEMLQGLRDSIHDRDPEVRSAVAWALASFQRSYALPQLYEMVSDDTLEVASTAVSALGTFESREPVPALISLLNDKRPAIVHQAVNSLAELRDARTTAKILPFLHSSDEPLRLTTIHALHKIGDRRSDRAVNRTAEGRRSKRADRHGRRRSARSTTSARWNR